MGTCYTYQQLEFFLILLYKHAFQVHSYDSLGEGCISLTALSGPLKRRRALFQLYIPGVNSELLGK